MSKILNATCVGGIVTCEGLPVPSAFILSQGVGSSSGVLLMQDDKQYYVALTTPDVNSILVQLTDLIPKLITAFTSIASGMTGPTTAPPPSLTTDLAALTAINVQLTLLKSMLK